MAFPSSIPSFAGFTGSHTLAVDNHAAQHNQEQADIVAVATKIGTGSSTPTSGKLLRGNGTGTSIWGQADLTAEVTGVLPIANGGTGTTSTTGTGSAVFSSSPTIITPTVASFANAQHNHTGPAGAGLLPLIARFQVFAASGTYIPNASMQYCVIEAIGGGGAGGGVTGNATYVVAGAGGGAGGYSRSIKSAAIIGASQAVTIGAGGTGVINGSGNAGSDTSLGSLVIAKGGQGGSLGGVAGLGNISGGAGGVAGTGDFALAGAMGEPPAIQGQSNLFAVAGATGGNSYVGGAGTGTGTTTSNSGNAGINGSGGSGGAVYNSASNVAGATGGTGLVIVMEYCSQ